MAARSYPEDHPKDFWILRVTWKGDSQLPKEADAYYARTGAKHGDKDRIILWYKPIGSEKYRVIYAVLSVRESYEMLSVAEPRSSQPWYPKLVVIISFSR